MSDFAARAYQIESTPPGLMRGGLAPGAVVQYSIVPDVYTDSANGSAYDFGSAIGNAFVIVAISVTGGNTFTVSIEESANGSQWAGVSGASSVVCNLSENKTSIVNFQQTKRYIRAVLSVDVIAGNSANVCAIIGKQ